MRFNQVIRKMLEEKNIALNYDQINNLLNTEYDNDLDIDSPARIGITSLGNKEKYIKYWLNNNTNKNRDAHSNHPKFKKIKDINGVYLYYYDNY